MGGRLHFKGRKVAHIAVFLLLILVGALLFFSRFGAKPTLCGTSTCQCYYCSCLYEGACSCDSGGVCHDDKKPCGCTGGCEAGNKCDPHHPAADCPEGAWCRDSDCKGGGGNATPTPTLTPTPTPPPCQVGYEYVKLIPPSASFYYYPPFPIVEGQDPQKRGVDFTIYAYGGRAEKYRRELVKECNGGGTYPDDCPNDWHWECVDKLLERHDDPLREVKIELNLSQESIAWITGELARKYPGARVKGNYPRLIDLLRSGRTMSFYAQVRKKLLVDPGKYEFKLLLDTTGTPISDPQHREYRDEIRCYLREEKLW